MSINLTTPGGIYCTILATCAVIIARLLNIHGLTKVAVARCPSVFACLPALSILIPTSGYAVSTAPTSLIPQGHSIPNTDTNSSALLECLQVTAPISHPPTNCQQTLMLHTFANAYGRPFVGFYTPPRCSFNRVTFNFTVTSAGRQFDRLGLMFMGDVEVFRTSTAEPTQNGIIWSYTKDMTSVLSLFNTPQKIIFDLGNLIDDTYTGSWNTELTATFITENQPFDAADLIVPLSARRSATNESSAFSVPETAAANTLILPTNIKKAVFSIAACGQGAEEFWWSNVLSSDTDVFGNDTQLYGHSAFRELQLLIDGTLVGVAWPFPIIFTGGVVPGFWRPVVGIDAFDLHEDEIDITPLVPLLSDGQEHTFHIRVVGIDDDGQGFGVLTENVESSWIVTGKIFIWLNSDMSNTTGSITSISVPEPILHLQSTIGRSQGATDVVKYSVNVTRQLSIESTIFTSQGGPKLVTWKQDLTFYNLGTIQNKGNDQTVQQVTFGVHNSSSGFYRKARYPLLVASSYHVYTNGNVTIGGEMRRGKDTVVWGELSSPNNWRTSNHTQLPSPGRNLLLPRGSMISNWQNGTATYASVPAQKKSYGTGSTEQIYILRLIEQDGGLTPELGGSQPTARELYRRHILATNNSVVHDEENFGGQLMGQPRYFSVWGRLPWSWLHEFAERGVQALVGRGPV